MITHRSRDHLVLKLGVSSVGSFHGRSCWKNSKHVYDDQEWLNTTPGHLVDDFDNDLSLMSDNECYYYDDQYCDEESDDDSPYYLYSDYEDISESDN